MKLLIITGTCNMIFDSKLYICNVLLILFPLTCHVHQAEIVFNGFD
jgi:hypothetical protein